MQHRPFIDIEPRVMVWEDGTDFRVASPCEKEAAGDVLHIVGEVLTDHERCHLDDAIRSDDTCGTAPHMVGLGRMVDDGGIATNILELIMCLTGRADVGDGAFHLGDDACLRLRGERSHRARQLCLVGDDVERLTGDERADGQDGRFERVDATTDDLLQLADDVRADYDGIDRMLRDGTMPSFTFDGQFEPVSRCHDRSGLHANRAEWERCPNMRTINVIDPVEAAVFNHRFGPARREFFRELMDEDDVSWKFDFRKCFR